MVHITLGECVAQIGGWTS
ncbi:hypothetical protein BAE44_0005063 [Dichanthelium oligosanthes]|uniref:Uncharacterized protein n=1 Tax=Dichanthelium oligosanthes TaxID=888268 RepID=A0A1E5W918_9POAL|nr:hypothetical protein BAE44_0005063 [Dichanthelium oligosanthes]